MAGALCYTALLGLSTVLPLRSFLQPQSDVVLRLLLYRAAKRAKMGREMNRWVVEKRRQSLTAP